MILRGLPKIFSKLLFRSFESKEIFIDQVKKLRAQYPNKPIAFVCEGGGFVEFLAVRLFLFEAFHKEFALRLATRLPNIVLEPPRLYLKRIASAFRLSPKPPSRLEQCSKELSQKRPILLLIGQKERRKLYEVPTSEYEITYLRSHHPELLLVPLVMIWKRVHRSDYTKDSILEKFFKILFFPIWFSWTLFLGSPYQPTALRKIILMLRQYAKSSIRTLSPLPAKDKDAKFLRRKVIRLIFQEKRTVLGPNFGTTRLINSDILVQPSFIEFSRTLSVEKEIPLQTIQKNAAAYLKEIAAITNQYYISLLENTFNKFFKYVYKGIETNKNDFVKLRDAQHEGPLVFVPNHVSYIDFLVIPFALYEHQFSTPFFFAGINLNFWPAGNILRHCGAFFVRRSFKGNRLYREVLKRYMGNLLTHKFNIAFFLEGTRSRNGKLAPPKYGVLNMLLEAYFENLIPKNTKFVPVSLSYDKLTEDQAHIRELEGGKKPSENMLNVFKSADVLTKRYGKVYLRIGEIITMDQWLNSNFPNRQHDQELRRDASYKLAFECSHQINNVKPVTAGDLVCMVMLCKQKSSISRSELIHWIQLITEDSIKRKVALHPYFLNDPEKATKRAIAQLTKDKIIKKTKHMPDGQLIIKLTKKNWLHAFHKMNSAAHAYVVPALNGLASNDENSLLELRSLLEFEFFFASKKEFLSQMSSLDSSPLFPLYSRILDHVFQNIKSGLEALIEMKALSFDRREWVSKLMKWGKLSFDKGDVTRFEAINTQSYKAFIDMAVHNQWLKIHPSKTKLLTVGDPELIKEKIKTIEKYSKKIKSWEDLKKINFIIQT